MWERNTCKKRAEKKPLPRPSGGIGENFPTEQLKSQHPCKPILQNNEREFQTKNVTSWKRSFFFNYLHFNWKRDLEKKTLIAFMERSIAVRVVFIFILCFILFFFFHFYFFFLHAEKNTLNSPHALPWNWNCNLKIKTHSPNSIFQQMSSYPACS